MHGGIYARRRSRTFFVIVAMLTAEHMLTLC
jgi:hypothetical protein